MKRYYRDFISNHLGGIFEKQDAENVLSWFISNHGQRPVVVVGSGFSRNGVFTGTASRTGRNSIPLWNDIVRKLESDLRVSQGRYDALTLAELHHEEMGPSGFSRTLTKLVPDEDLQVGEAHKSLFEFDMAAMVTTNCLDTLLDKNGRGWHRIISDSDLGMGGSQEVDLIYFHGHRSHPSSWVFTRSQYEDIWKSKPLIVTRVRQLLSQNPVLILGYSLSDPDFHHIYRQVSLDMTYHHPLGLAVFPCAMGPSPAERRHWEKLGIRIAAFRDSDFTTSLKKFLKFNPASAGFHTPPAFVVEQLTAEKDFDERCAYAREYFNDQDSGSAEERPRHSEYRIWQAVIRSAFTGKQWQELTTIYGGDEVYDRSIPTARKFATRADPRSSFHGFNSIEAERFGCHESFFRQIDAFLTQYPNLKLSLARWLSVAISSQVPIDNLRDHLDMSSWLWRTIFEAKGDDAAVQMEAKAAIRSVLVLAKKYDYAVERISKDAEAVGVEPQVVEPFHDRNSEFSQNMRDGFIATLNGEFAAARIAYGQAAAIAAGSTDKFGEWLALTGETKAFQYTVEFGDPQMDEKRAVIAEYELKLDLLKSASKVRHWLEETRGRGDSVREKIIKQAANERRRRSAGSEFQQFDNYAHYYWISFRELEVISACPSLQERHLQLLIDLGGLEPANELEYRLRLGLDRTEKIENWLESVVSDSSVSLESQQHRDMQLLELFTKSAATRFERYRRLVAFPAMTPIFRMPQVDWAPSFLAETRKILGTTVKTHKSTSHLFPSYPEAWASYAALESSPARAVENLVRYGECIEHDFERDTFFRSVANLPLEQWVGLEDHVHDLLASLLSKLNTERSSKAPDFSSERLGWAYYSLLDAAHRFGRSVDDLNASAIRTWAENMCNSSAESGEDTDSDDAFGAAICLGWLLAQGDEAREQIVEAAGTKIEEVCRLATTPRRHLEPGLRMWGNLKNTPGFADTAFLRNSGAKLWETLFARWEVELKHAQLNGHLAGPYAAFLAELIRANDVEDIAACRDRLLSVLRVAPRELYNCGSIMSRRHWGDQWGAFVDAVWTCAARNTESHAANMGVIDMFSNWIDGTESINALDQDLRFLVDVVCFSVLDERRFVANHAAYSVIGLASRSQRKEDIARVIGPLRRLAKDPRLDVRGAAAYASTRLQHNSVAPEIVDVARKLDDQFADDDYAIIQRQRVFGELERDHPRTAT